jgi:DNA-binding NarL/FixJ family response regulator
VRAKKPVTAVVFTDALKRLRVEYDRELVEEVERRNLQHALMGGGCIHDLFIHFSLTMRTESLARLHFKTFHRMLPSLCDALCRAHPRQLLTSRETAVLQRRTMGEITKQIAVMEGISERTVREHLQSIKKKLHTNDLVNAVAIALKNGVLVHTWKTAHRHVNTTGKSLQAH